MAHKILIALDDSEGSWRGVEYVAQTFGQTPGIEVTLLHVLVGLPPSIWEEGHILNQEEKKARDGWIAKWEADKEKKWDALIQRARERLMKAGIPPRAIKRQFELGYSDVAEEVLEEAREGKYSMVVMGRRGTGRIKSLLLGSITQKVLNHAHGFAVTIAE